MPHRAVHQGISGGADEHQSAQSQAPPGSRRRTTADLPDHPRIQARVSDGREHLTGGFGTVVEEESYRSRERGNRSSSRSLTLAQRARERRGAGSERRDLDPREFGLASGEAEELAPCEAAKEAFQVRRYFSQQVQLCRGQTGTAKTPSTIIDLLTGDIIRA